MASLSLRFLKELRQSYTDGDIYPPWVPFALAIPGIGWTQGVQAAWWFDCWSPFWLAMPDEERQSYLRRWKANDEWSEFLLNDPRRHAERAAAASA